MAAGCMREEGEEVEMRMKLGMRVKSSQCAWGGGDKSPRHLNYPAPPWAPLSSSSKARRMAFISSRIDGWIAICRGSSSARGGSSIIVWVVIISSTTSSSESKLIMVSIMYSSGSILEVVMSGSVRLVIWGGLSKTPSENTSWFLSGLICLEVVAWVISLFLCFLVFQVATKPEFLDLVPNSHSSLS